MSHRIQIAAVALIQAFSSILEAQPESSNPQKEIPILDWPIESVSTGHGFTEGAAIGPDGSVYFSDLENGQILKFDPDSNKTQIWTDKSHFSNGLLISGNTLYACEAAGRSVVSYDLQTGPSSRQILADKFEQKRFGSPNDLALVGDQIVFSSFYWDWILPPDDNAREIHENRSYTLSLKEGTVSKLPQHFETPNGVVFDPIHNQLYLTEMKLSRIYRATVSNGEFGPTELFIDLQAIGKGKPDGMTVDQDGRLYVALYGQSNQLLLLSPDAKPIGVLPTGQLTSNCTITPDGKTLYITAEKTLKRVSLPPSP
ncbi:SMP-30/gluconolactonase/LRE family protein [Pelagicoccus mobilis]|uniref:SMP-30/gluconolactonase/LRE family protein n=1 Tax=Pelagicoccus mobilis TaxID=415221 RepID=A0A934S577_9BACT|nr:SMP-30/gluconolactonase/LRE family protein [Pelagicoccus mobilis]MBK1879183.1 SMP-30/gluconolactonase/LRE family protein [Pelagicoccus mobilis]